MALFSFLSAFIFFVKKPKDNFYLYIYYQNLNNLTIKNQYFLLLIRNFWDYLGYAKKLSL